MSPRQSRSGGEPVAVRAVRVVVTHWVLGGPESLIGHFQDYVRGQLGERR